jgi:hypothetical protein
MALFVLDTGTLNLAKEPKACELRCWVSSAISVDLVNPDTLLWNISPFGDIPQSNSSA